MQFIKKNYGILIGLLLFLLFLFYVSNDSQKMRRYDKNLPFHRSYVNIQIYTNDIKLGNTVIQKLEELYAYYHSLITEDESHLHGIFYVKNNKQKGKELKINEDLYQVLELGKKWEEKSRGKISLSSFPLQELWNQNIDKKIVCDEKDIHKVKQAIKKVNLLKEGKIENNHPSLQLDGILNGYVLQKAQDILNKYGISMYLINTDGVISSGKAYQKKYRIALEDTFSHDYYRYLQIENKVVATKGMGEKVFEQNGTFYHNRINPDTGMPSFYHRGVSVVCDDAFLADFLSEVLFHMSIEEGKQYIEDYPDVEVIWYSRDKKITSTKGMEKYITKV